MKLSKLEFQNRQEPKGERGFTLVEILASLVVIAVAGLAMTAFFVNALSYAKGNQNKTVMINLARNTLFYMQKESDFKEMTDFFKGVQPIGSNDSPTIDTSGCQTASSCEYTELVADPQTLYYILNPIVNNIPYEITISYQDNLFKKLDSDGGTEDNGRIGEYLLPIKVEVREADTADDAASSSKREMTEVEGYITDESIR
ncbi:prepilin-type N-terminal cleavage/methylation domain-containing protein [Paenibacillus silvisoli]|uniref:prepilin-type N-terminal cleavage/methylation domain-containing protein n=1 Tax=Paenibacillus silvisoli TaxID=3110539 RepID=UPI002803D57D|nr:prepilin-type N-terminal cleavage/methylation domain-containing protein [Paenibacillus silvisoli]